MLILFLKVVLYDINSLKTDHVQPKTPLFTSDSKHPPRSGHAVYLGDKSSTVNPLYNDTVCSKLSLTLK